MMPGTIEASARAKRATVVGTPDTQVARVGGSVTSTIQVVIDGYSYVVEVYVPRETLIRLAKYAAANATGKSRSGGVSARVRK